MGLLREMYRRWLIARHSPRHWRLRPDTIDRRIFRHVVIDNEYRLPERFRDDDIILDVGAHMGAFALAALRRGARRIHCYEPDRDNHRLLQHNLAPFADRVALHPCAVWPTEQVALTMHNPLDPRNTGACQVTPASGGGGVDVVAFDPLIEGLTADGRRLRLVKFDCEGAEWPILLTTGTLERIEAVCGEYHLGELPEIYTIDKKARSVEALEQALAEAGFDVEIQPLSESPIPVGLFFGFRR